MKIVILPGRDALDKHAMHEMAFALSQFTDSLSLHHYGHWHSPSRAPDLSREAREIQKTLVDSPAYFLIGQAWGAELAYELISLSKHLPRACICINAPRSIQKHFTKRVPLLFLETEDFLFSRAEKTQSRVLPELTMQIQEFIKKHDK